MNEGQTTAGSRGCWGSSGEAGEAEAEEGEVEGEGRW